MHCGSSALSYLHYIKEGGGRGGALGFPLGLVLRPKCIYNFCLFHDLLGDIVICFATLLYFFTHIWTNLLTQCTQCQFLSADVFFAGTFTQFPLSQKSQEKYIKMSVTEASRSTKMGQRGSRGCPGGLPARPGPWPRPHVAWVGPTSSDRKSVV